MIFQEPMTSLNPAFTIGNQLEETYRRHRRTTAHAARDRALEMLEAVGITAAPTRLRQYPHQLSGGLRQRVMIAMALIAEPELLIADEPTTALDVTIQAQILHLLMRLQHRFQMALILITHDLGIVARIARRVLVMYAGQVVEMAPATALFSRPLHPYTQALLAAIPVPGRTPPGAMLQSIPGAVPGLFGDLGGCHFRNRCRFARAACAPQAVPLRALDDVRAFRCILPDGAPVIEPQTPDVAMLRAVQSTPALLETCEIARSYRVSTGFFKPKRLLGAVNGVSLALGRGEVVALVGKSGCGKTTLAHMLLGLEPPTGGRVLLDGKDVATLPRRAIAQRLQPVFQDPYSSLNAHKTIGATIGLPLRVHGVGNLASRRQRVVEMMRRVGLNDDYVDRYPAQLSGGQRQRVAIARALVMRPDIVICDEPTSALDVSVQAQILNLLLELGREFDLAYLLISHNLAVVQHMATRVAVMYLGRIVETGPTETIFRSPRHPYTRALLASVLTPEPGVPVPDPRLGGSMPNPLNPPTGCCFHPRCPEAMDVCRRLAPRPHAVAETPLVECHLYDATS